MADRVRTPFLAARAEARVIPALKRLAWVWSHVTGPPSAASAADAGSSASSSLVSRDGGGRSNPRSAGARGWRPKLMNNGVNPVDA
ncbi:hypothetical protein PI125_g16780 [Phytophthora idaei]|nr:hypothetical protein PI125_g16780 [Phytophthora idaei]